MSVGEPGSGTSPPAWPVVACCTASRAARSTSASPGGRAGAPVPLGLSWPVRAVGRSAPGASLLVVSGVFALLRPAAAPT